MQDATTTVYLISDDTHTSAAALAGHWTPAQIVTSYAATYDTGALGPRESIFCELHRPDGLSDEFLIYADGEGGVLRVTGLRDEWIAPIYPADLADPDLPHPVSWEVTDDDDALAVAFVQQIGQCIAKALTSRKWAEWGTEVSVGDLKDLDGAPYAPCGATIRTHGSTLEIYWLEGWDLKTDTSQPLDDPEWEAQSRWESPWGTQEAPLSQDEIFEALGLEGQQILQEMAHKQMRS